MAHLFWLAISGLTFLIGFVLGAMPQVKRDLRAPSEGAVRLMSVFKENGMVFARYSNGVVLCISGNEQPIAAKGAEKSRLDSLN